MKYFVLGDIHGCHKEMELALQSWDSQSQRLVQLGDMLDRGPDSLSVLLRMMELKENQNAIILKGNHEEMFLNFLDNPIEEGLWYFQSGGRETVKSFFSEEENLYRKTPVHVANYIKEYFSDVVDFIRSLPSYYEEGNWVFVHAGVNFSYEDWRNGSDKDFLWIRQHFHYGKNEHNVRFVFGHTPTRLLNHDKSDDIWISSCGTKIGIDGGAVFGGQMNALHIEGEAYRAEVIKG